MFTSAALLSHNDKLNRCSPRLPEHEWCHGSVAQAADRSGREREVHRGASLRVHPRMHCVWSAGHPSLPRLAGRPPGEMDLTHHRCCFSSPPWSQLVLLSSCPSSTRLFRIMKYSTVCLRSLHCGPLVFVCFVLTLSYYKQTKRCIHEVKCTARLPFLRKFWWLSSYITSATWIHREKDKTQLILVTELHWALSRLMGLFIFSCITKIGGRWLKNSSFCKVGCSLYILLT